MSENEVQSNININNSHLEMNIDPHSKYDELIENRYCQLIDEIYPPSQNEEDIHKKKYDEENKSESDEMKSTNLDSMINEEEKNPSPIIIDIKNSIKNDKDISKNRIGANINLSDNEDYTLQYYLEKMKEPKLELPSQSQFENSSKEITFKIELNNEVNYNSKSKLIGKKTKRKWKHKAISETSKKNKINDFIIKTRLELVNNKNNNITEDEDGDRLDIRENNFSELYCNRKFYLRSYSPHIIEMSESLIRYNILFWNDSQTISTKCNSLETNRY